MKGLKDTCIHTLRVRKKGGDVKHILPSISPTLFLTVKRLD